MPLISAYYRPDTLDEALSLLAEPNRIPLAGGTIVNADREQSDVEVVDLQALGLNNIETHGDRLRIGATATLAEVSESANVPEMLGSLARREEPGTIRTIATVGGSIASANAESALLAGLLVHDATVEMAGADDMSLADLLTSGVPAGAIITAVVIDPSGTLAHAATGRTPADTPIVAAVARSSNGATTLALSGVATTPILVNPDDPSGGLEPEGDFRGSSAYRIKLAAVLGTRAMEEIR